MKHGKWSEFSMMRVVLVGIENFQQIVVLSQR